MGMFLRCRCPLCGYPGPAPCDSCWSSLPPASPDMARSALLSFAGSAAVLMKRLKYANGRASVPRLGQGMATLVPLGWADAVTWAPTSRRRRQHRGFDQAELLARVVAAQLGVPCRSLLRRSPTAGAQTGRTRSERLHGPAFVAIRASPARVVVVDDVITTGATLRSAAAALRLVGAREVRIVAAAGTPSVPRGTSARAATVVSSAGG